MELVKWSPNLEEIKDWSLEEKGSTLFLEQHPEFPAYLYVDSLDPLYAHTLKKSIGQYRAVNKLLLNDFLEEAENEGYTKACIIGDPEKLFGFLETLDDPYPYYLNVTLKKFQLRGFNYTKDLPSAIINWSTGTGKSVYSVARAKYLLERGKIDKVIVLSKSHNKINWQRTFWSKGNLLSKTDEEAVGGTPERRRQSRVNDIYSSQIFIVNYEKLRFRSEPTQVRDMTGRKRPDPSGDGQEILDALEGQRVFWIWDEMPNKMKSMNTSWYRGAEKILKVTKKNYQVELTAKKLDTNPENVYSCTKILDKTIWSNVADFRSRYARSMSSFSPWQVATWDAKKLPEIGMRLAHMTHVANKYTDPEIRAEFPEDHWEDVIIDMSKQDRKLYEAIQTDIIAELKGDYNTILTKIIPLQLMCNNPALLNVSNSKLAQAMVERYKFTDQHAAKLDTLRDMLSEIDGKVVIFTMYNDLGVKMLAPYLAQWGYSYVTYDGNSKRSQAAQDRFRSDSRIKVFLSSDKGSDSIDLEQATSVINYDLPWNHSTLIQRVNRISRLTSEAEHVFYYNLITADTLEERKVKLLEKKRKMEEAIDTDLSISSELITNSSVNDLLWILTG